MFKIIIGLAALVLLIDWQDTFPIVATQSAPVLHRTYSCRGNSPDGTDYMLTLTIEPQQDTYVLSWDAGQLYGIGFRSGASLAAAFVNAQTGFFSVVVYLISDGALHGRWAGGDGLIYREDCLVGSPAGA